MNLSKYEELLDEVSSYGIKVLELELGGDCGYCLNDMIFINQSSCSTSKYCILAEEFGHYLRTVGDITNLNLTENIKQEIKARRWSYDKILNPNKIIKVLLSGVTNLCELSEQLEVTESFLKEALEYYKNKHGIYYVGDTHLLIFEPLHVLEIF